MNTLDLIDFRHGRWQDVIGDTKADHLILDAPYSDRTHAGGELYPPDRERCRPINDFYAPWGQAEVSEVCEWAVANVRQWVVSMTDHFLFPVWQEELEKRGYYVFAPVVLVEMNRSVRITGDGPSTWSTEIVVARPRTAKAMRWRALPGAYVTTRSADKMPGGKPLSVMQDIVRDYSNRGDTIVDLTAGNATTLIAAASMGRKSVGCELDFQTWSNGMSRLTDRLHSPLFDTPTQHSLL